MTVDFAELASQRMLAQHPDPGNLAALLQALAEGQQAYHDVALEVRDGFDVATAVGAQLDMIGSVVGLTREGFADERYRVFLLIQTKLLLATAREDASWTGTSPNILAIARAFIGDSITDPIVLVNTPPYEYSLSVPAGGFATYAEIALLARFLRTANYAGVGGTILAELEEGSTWGSDSVVVTGAGVWGSVSVSIPDAATWGTAVEV
jgi:hypothetical protein